MPLMAVFPWTLVHTQVVPPEAGLSQTKPSEACTPLGVPSVNPTLDKAGSTCFGLSHLAPSSSTLFASAEPPWEEVASKTQLLPLDNTGGGHTPGHTQQS